MAWTTPPTITAGVPVPAASLNIYSADLTAIGGPAIAWAPTLTNFTATTTARAWQMGKRIECEFQFVLTGTPTGVVAFSLPTAAATNYAFAIYTSRGMVTGLRQGTGYRNASVYLASATTAGFVSDSATGGWANAVPVAWASADVWGGRLIYEAA